MELTGFEPVTPSLRTRCSAWLSYSPLIGSRDSTDARSLQAFEWKTPCRSTISRTDPRSSGVPSCRRPVGLGQGYLDVDESVIGGLMRSAIDKGRGFVRVTGRARIRPRSFENWDRIQLCLRREGNGAWIIEGDEALRSLPRDDMRTSVSHILELAKELGSWPNAP